MPAQHLLRCYLTANSPYLCCAGLYWWTRGLCWISSCEYCIQKHFRFVSQQNEQRHTGANCGCFPAKGRSRRDLEMILEHVQQVCEWDRVPEAEFWKCVRSIATAMTGLSSRWQHQRVPAQLAILSDLHRAVEHLHHVLHDLVSQRLSVTDTQIIALSETHDTNFKGLKAIFAFKGRYKYKPSQDWLTQTRQQQD